MTNQEIQNVLINILKDKYRTSHYEEYPEEITSWTRLGEFAFDSLDLTEIIMDLEKELGIEIQDDVAEGICQNYSAVSSIVLTLANIINKTQQPATPQKTVPTKKQPIIELYELNPTTLQFRQDGKILGLYDEKVKPYMDILRKELAKQKTNQGK